MEVDLTTFELNAAMRRTSAELLEACAALRQSGRKYGRAQSTFKKRHAQSLLASEKKTDSQKKADADEETAGDLLAALIADGDRVADLELVRSLRGVLSSLQSEAKGNVEEMAFSRTAPQYER